MATPQVFTAEPFFAPATEELRFLPEGPRVLRTGKTLGWVAIQHGAGRMDGSINLLNLATRENRSLPLPGRPGFFAETSKPGVVLVGLERRLIYFDLIAGRVEEGFEIPVTGDERVIINDGLAVEGGVLFGTKHLEFNKQIACLYYFDAHTAKVHTLLDDQLCSNGKFLRELAGGEAVLIDIDSIPKAISRYRLDAQRRRILDRSLVAPPESLPGFPDGLRPTSNGESIVVAFYNPEPVDTGVAQEIRLADGAVLTEWRLPGSPRVTCPEFVEMDGKVKLLFTTADEGMPAAVRALAPGAGAIYIADTPFQTVPAAPPLVAYKR